MTHNQTTHFQKNIIRENSRGEREILIPVQRIGRSVEHSPIRVSKDSEELDAYMTRQKRSQDEYSHSKNTMIQRSAQFLNNSMHQREEQTAVATVEAELAKYKARCKHLQSHLEKLDHFHVLYTSLKHEFDKNDRSLKHRIAELQQSLDLKEDELGDLQGQLKKRKLELQENNRKYTQQISSKDQELEQLSKKLSRLEQEEKRRKKQYQNETEQLRDKIHELESQIRASNDQRDKLKKEYQTLKSRYSQLEYRSNSSTLEEEMSRFKRELRQREDDIQKLKKQLFRKEEEIEALRNNGNNSNSGKYDARERQLEGEFRRLLEQRKDQQAHMKDIIQRIQQCEEENREYHKDNTQLYALVEKKQKEMEKMGQQIQELKSRLRAKEVREVVEQEEEKEYNQMLQELRKELQSKFANQRQYLEDQKAKKLEEATRERQKELKQQEDKYTQDRQTWQKQLRAKDEQIKELQAKIAKNPEKRDFTVSQENYSELLKKYASCEAEYQKLKVVCSQQLSEIHQLKLLLQELNSRTTVECGYHQTTILQLQEEVRKLTVEMQRRQQWEMREDERALYEAKINSKNELIELLGVKIRNLEKQLYGMGVGLRGYRY